MVYTEGLISDDRLRDFHPALYIKTRKNKNSSRGAADASTRWCISRWINHLWRKSTIYSCTHVTAHARQKALWRRRRDNGNMTLFFSALHQCLCIAYVRRSFFFFVRDADTRESFLFAARESQRNGEITMHHYYIIYTGASVRWDEAWLIFFFVDEGHKTQYYTPG